MMRDRNEKILRVFPWRTNFTPRDDLVYIANGNLTPPFMSLFPDHDEVHISCIFTWDKNFCQQLKYQLESVTNKPVKLGGPAFLDQATDFDQGRYLRGDVIFTSRGCNHHCPWCIVSKIEGALKEIKIVSGKIIQDNNFLQTNKKHQEKVIEMLKKQKGICFKGGLESDLITDAFVESLQGLKIKELWLACDTDEKIRSLKKACKKLINAGFTQEHIKCYCLIGDDINKNEARLQEVYHAGAMPFAQLYRDFSDEKTKYSKEWNAFARQWQRPPAIKAHMKKGTSFYDYSM